MANHARLQLRSVDGCVTILISFKTDIKVVTYPSTDYPIFGCLSQVVSTTLVSTLGVNRNNSAYCRCVLLKVSRAMCDHCYWWVCDVHTCVSVCVCSSQH